MCKDTELVVYKEHSDVIVIQSKKFKCGVPRFLLKVKDDLTYTSFHCGSTCTIESLSSNRIRICKQWSILDEIIRFLRNKEESHKTEVVFQHLAVMGKRNVGKSVYPAEIIIRGFEYFATSRSLYNQLAIDYQLPSVRTLTRITSKVSSEDDMTYLKKVLECVDNRQRKCIIMLDEVYVKAALLYHGGSLFGQSVNHPNMMAKTVLAYMIKCLYGGPEFLTKILPVCKLNADFQFAQCQPIINNIRSQPEGEVLSIIADGNRVNQNFFKKFPTVEGKPWLGTNNCFYLFDYVHILKCIRNNWLTEKCGELEFEWKREIYIARWSDLQQLYSLESEKLTKLSKLNETAVFPKPIERQSVSTCLRVFCAETIAALETHPAINKDSVMGTIQFLKIIVSFWKIVNVNSTGIDKRYRDELRGEIRSSDDPRLDTLLEIAVMSQEMKAKTSSVRIRQLTQDTSRCFSHVCRGLVDLARYLLLCGNDYVLLGWFTTDPLEKCFSKLRQGSGGTYFITAKCVVENVRIQHAKLALQLDMDIEGNHGHSCSTCLRKLTEGESEIVDSLIELEKSIHKDTLLSLVYISGYVQKGDKGVHFDDTNIYYNKYGDYIDALNRGGLKVPSDTVVQWAIFCFILFTQLSGTYCRTFLVEQFLTVSQKFAFSITTKQCRILANIFLKNYCSLLSPRSNKEPQQKKLKLS